MPRVTAFSVPITPDDMVDVEMKIDRGAIVDFKVNYRAQFRGQWSAVVRYDTEHGELHVHRFYAPGRDVRKLRRRRAGARDYTPDVARAEADLVRNWRVYRARMEALLHGDP